MKGKFQINHYGDCSIYALNCDICDCGEFRRVMPDIAKGLFSYITTLDIQIATDLNLPYMGDKRERLPTQTPFSQSIHTKSIGIKGTSLGFHPLP